MSVLLKRNSSNLYHNWDAVTSSDVLFYSLLINRFQKKCFFVNCELSKPIEPKLNNKNPVSFI